MVSDISAWKGEILKTQKKWRVTLNDVNDYQLKGKYGAITVYPDGDLDVWVKNIRIFLRMERIWKAKQHWDDGGLFVRPYADLDVIAKCLRCSKRRTMSPENRQKASERFARMRSLKQKPLSRASADLGNRNWARRGQNHE